MMCYPWPSGDIAGCHGGPLPQAVHITRHHLKYDSSPAPPISSCRNSSFQRAHKDWFQLNSLNGSRAPGLAQASWMVVIVSPWSQGASRTGLFFKRPFGRPVLLSRQRRKRHFHLVQRRACCELNEIAYKGGDMLQASSHNGTRWLTCTST